MLEEVSYLRSLLALSRHEELEAILDATLAAVTGRVGAGHGYIELDADGDAHEPWLWRARDCTGEHVSFIRERISRGILMEARMEGRTVATASAIADPRFKDLESVKQHQIGAVLCVPFDGFWGFGVLYLQGRAVGEFDAKAREDAEIATGQLKLVIDARPTKLGEHVGVRNEMDARKRQLVAMPLI